MFKFRKRSNRTGEARERRKKWKAYTKIRNREISKGSSLKLKVFLALSRGKGDVTEIRRRW